MSTYTNWYHLDKYEGQDKPNLLDQYNSAMDKVDSALHQIAENGGSGGGGSTPIIVPSENQYDGKNIVFIGDSYSVGVGYGGVTNASQRFTSIIAATLNMTEYNFAVGGTGFIFRNQNEKHIFTQQIQDANNAMSTDEKNDTYLVIIAGGCNEVWGTTAGTYTYAQEYTAVQTTITLAQSIFRNAKILVVPMLYKGFKFTRYAKTMYDAIVNAVHDLRFFNVQTMEGCYTWNWGDKNLYGTDNVHPTAAGHAKFADHIIHGIFGELIQWEDKIFEINFDTSIVEPGSNPNQEAGNCIQMKQGIMYAGPFRLFVKNTTLKEVLMQQVIPQSALPDCTAFGTVAGAYSYFGMAFIGHTGDFGINVTETELHMDQGINVTQIVYPIYGRGYGLTA